MYNVSDNYKALIAQPVRYTGISGTVTLKTGAQVALSDDGIDGGSLSIVRRLNRRGDFRTGGVYSAELSVGLKGFAGKTSDLDGARISLTFLLYGADRATSESVPLGVFYVDGATIRRRSALVTLRADDAMMMFDVPAQETSGTYYELASAACSACGVSLATAQAAFAELPNGSKSAALNTARVQTWRDLLMYIGQATASFARINRSGALEFVPITAEKTDSGVIIPVREIAGGVRFSTEFSDDTTRVSRVFMQRNGQRLGSTRMAVGGSARLMQLELPENPLFAALTDDEVKEALNAQFSVLYQCLNRAFSTDFNGDPALDVGDYVRLRGGAIDTERGYGTGMITSQVWRYRGAHTIKCVMPASFAVSGSAQAVSVKSAAAQDESAEAVRVPPKSQTEKEIDELRARLNAAANPAAPLTEYAVTSDSVVKYNGVTYTAEFAEGGAIAKISDDKGGEFAPTFAAGVTNIALHNAVFWAVAMARGLRRPAAADALTKMCAYRYNCDSMAQSGANITWRNQAAGGNVDCTFSGAALNGDGVFVQGSAASQGIIPYVATNSAMPRTIYIVARNASANSLRTLTAPGAGSWNTSVLLGGANSVWTVYGQVNTAGFATSASSLQKTVICIAIDAAAQVKVYINGEYAGSAPTTAPKMTSGSVQLGGVSSYYDGGGYYYYDVAIADELHEDADIAANSAYLTQKYNVQ